VLSLSSKYRDEKSTISCLSVYSACKLLNSKKKRPFSFKLLKSYMYNSIDFLKYHTMKITMNYLIKLTQRFQTDRIYQN
jgi:hypothetical protein